MDLAYALAHFIYPKSSNNHKAKLLHSSSIFILASFMVAYQLILQVIPFSGLKILGYAASIPTDEIIRLTNVKRTEAGVGTLSYNSLLTQAARMKGQDMLAKGYWAHIAPDGTEPWYFFTQANYKYKYAGENLARDFSNPTDAINAWMASPSHRENLLSGKYKDTGVAVVEGKLAGVDTTIIVQLFGTALGDTANQVPVARATTQTVTKNTLKVTPTEVITPTLVPSITPEPTKTSMLITGSTDTQKPSFLAVLLSPFQSTRTISLAVTLILLIVLVIDGIVITRRKVTRISSRNLAHFAFLGMVLTIILIAKAGKII